MTGDLPWLTDVLGRTEGSGQDRRLRPVILPPMQPSITRKKHKELHVIVIV